MPGPVFRQGETVELRSPTEDDVEFLQENVMNPQSRQSLIMSYPITQQQEREWVERATQGDAISTLVCVDGDPVGTIGLNHVNDVWGTGEVGYAIHPDYWGNGYATDALQTICDYAFGDLRLERLNGRAYETNPGSCRVMEKVGFQQEGILRDEAFVEGERVDVVRYGLLVDEWFENEA
ncbi:GNAT family N-acetyltransferase [Halobacteriales archaeon Cl-PHB]